MSYSAVQTAVVAKSSFQREGIKSYLAESHYVLATEEPTFDFGAPERPSLIISSLEDFMSAPSLIQMCASDDEIKLVLVCQDFSFTNQTMDILRRANGVLDCAMDRKAFLNALDLVMIGVAVHCTKSMNFFAPRTDYRQVQIMNGDENMASGQDMPCLSTSEMKVLRCLANGSSNKHIAIRYNLAEATIKIHVKNILRKLKANNRTQAAIWAREHGIHFSAHEVENVHGTRVAISVQHSSSQ